MNQNAQKFFFVEFKIEDFFRETWRLLQENFRFFPEKLWIFSGKIKDYFKKIKDFSHRKNEKKN